MNILDYLIDRLSDNSIGPPIMIMTVLFTGLGSMFFFAAGLYVLAYTLLATVGTVIVVLLGYAFSKAIKKDYQSYMKNKRP